jgi:hypothetical protein
MNHNIHDWTGTYVFHTHLRAGAGSAAVLAKHGLMCAFICDLLSLE